MARRLSAAEAERAAEARRQKLDELHQQLIDGIGSLQSSDRWREFLTFAQGLHRYSFNNLMLIWAQNPDATLIASFNAWKERGHHVRKGETALRVLAPMTRRVTAEDPTGKPLFDKDGQPVKKTIITGFKPVPVFDASQVEPAVDRPDIPPLLPGQAPDGLWDALAGIVEDHQYRLERGDCAGANGYTNFTARVIRVRDDVDPVQAVKTLAHEVGHMLLHQPEPGQERAVCRGTIEVEAESVAFMVAAAHGLDTSDYTFAYVAGWAEQAAAQQKVDQVEVIQSTGQRVIACADKILTITKPPATEAQNEAMSADLAQVGEQVAQARATAPRQQLAMRPLSTPAPTAAPDPVMGVSAGI